MQTNACVRECEIFVPKAGAGERLVLVPERARAAWPWAPVVLCMAEDDDGMRAERGPI